VFAANSGTYRFVPAARHVMIQEIGIVLRLVVPEDATDGYYAYSTFTPPECRCSRCRVLLPGWYPKPPPQISLIMHDEELMLWNLGVLVLHGALFEILHEYCWPEALATPCITHPESKLDIGHQYVAVTLPPLYLTQMLTTMTEAMKYGPWWQCVVCKRYRYPMGMEREGSVPYVALGISQRDGAAFADPDCRSLFVTTAIRKLIDKLRIGSYGWQTVAIYSERLPHHVVQDEVM